MIAASSMFHAALFPAAAQPFTVPGFAFVLAGRPGSFVSVLLKLPLDPAGIAAFLQLPNGTTTVLGQHFQNRNDLNLLSSRTA